MYVNEEYDRSYVMASALGKSKIFSDICKKEWDFKMIKLNKHRYLRDQKYIFSSWCLKWLLLYLYAGNLKSWKL